MSSSTPNSDCTCFVYWRFFLSWSRCPNYVAILGGRCFSNCWLLRPENVRNFPFLVTFRKVLGVGLKHNLWIYWISSVFVLSLVIIAIARFLTGLDIDMSHRPSFLYTCPFKISAFTLRIFISFLFNMVIQSSSDSWHKDINKTLCNP